MLETYKDQNGNIQAVAEWWTVDRSGNFAEKGDYVWISELEINKDYRHKGLIRYFIKQITDKAPWTKYGYFWRKRKYNNRPARIYSRRVWLNYGGVNA